MMASTFSISPTDLIASICRLESAVHFWLVLRVICSFKKDILSSIVFCRVVIIYLVKPVEMDCYSMASILEEGGFVMLEGQREQEEYLSKKPLVIII